MRVIDLFSGCGGMSLGFQNAGFQIVAAYDNWQPAIDIYQRNFQHPIFKKDLSTEDVVPELKDYSPDMIIGGPPCQDFSIAGKREFRGKRANLTLKFGQIVSEVRPQWFVMENVYNIEKSPIFEEVLAIFKSAGYGITKHVWDASYMGVPQMRRRYFVVGKLGGRPVGGSHMCKAAIVVVRIGGIELIPEYGRYPAEPVLFRGVGSIRSGMLYG